MDSGFRLIMRKRPVTVEEAQSMALALSRDFSIDPYQTRFAMKGDGLSLLHSGDEPALRMIGKALSDYGFEWCVIPPEEPLIEPLMVKNFRSSDGSMILEGSFGGRNIGRRDWVLAILGGMEGQVPEKLIHKAVYSGIRSPALSPDEKLKTILSSGAVLDLYIQGSGESSFEGPFRIQPGKFDPSGLGDEKTISARRNMEITLGMVKKNSGRFSLDLDFGLATLPRCGVVAMNSPDAEKSNLESLSNYGRYLSQFLLRTGYESSNATAPSGAGKPASFESPLPPPPGDRAVRRARLVDSNLLKPGLIFFIWLSSVISVPMISVQGGKIFIQGGVFLFLLSAGFFYWSFKTLGRKRWMDNMPTSRARSVALGMVEIKGFCERMYNLVTPMTQFPCVYYRLKKYKLMGPTGRQTWKLIDEKESGDVPFILRDETGRVVVDPRGACIRSSGSHQFNEGSLPFPGAGAAIPRDTRYEEEFISEGAEIYVLGFASDDGRRLNPVHKRLVEKLKMLKHDRTGIKKYDIDEDGHVDIEEWDAARNAMEKEVLAEILSDDGNRRNPEPGIIIRKPDVAGLPFVISGSSEERMALNHSLLAWTLFSGAVLSAIAGLMMTLKFVSQAGGG